MANENNPETQAPVGGSHSSRHVQKGTHSIYQYLEEDPKGHSPMDGDPLSKVDGESYDRRLREMERKENRAIKQHTKSSAAQRKAWKRYYQKKRIKLNEARRIRARRPHEIFNKARKRALKKGEEWTLTFTQWMDVWNSCPPVVSEVTGYEVDAWYMRGSDPRKSIQMWRKNLKRGWTLDNVHMVYKQKEVLYDPFEEIEEQIQDEVNL